MADFGAVGVNLTTVRVGDGSSLAHHPVDQGAIGRQVILLSSVISTLDSASVRLSLSPSSSDIASVSDSTTTKLTLTPSSTDIRQGFDSTTAVLILTPGSTDIFHQAISVDTAIIYLHLTPKGTDRYRNILRPVSGTIEIGAIKFRVYG